MWGEKHNLHHARTNEVSFFLFLGSPSSFVLALNVAILLYCWLLVSIRDSTILPLIAPFFRLRVLSNALLSLCSSRQSRWAWIRTYPVVLCCLFGPLPRRTISPGGATNICTCLLPIVCSLSFGAWTASKLLGVDLLLAMLTAARMAGSGFERPPMAQIPTGL